MSKSPFDPERQNVHLTAKITAGLERVSSVFRALLWEHAKTRGLSPIQLQILIFVLYHDDSLCNVSHLAKEFKLTKPTISDALKVLSKKKLIIKVPSELDKRAFTVALSVEGKKVAEETELFASPVEASVNKLSQADKEQLFSSLKVLISGLSRTGIISVQRSCFGCRFYEKRPDSHFCHFLNKALSTNELRIDCPEFEVAS